MARKTFEVSKLVGMVNLLCKVSAPADINERQSAMTILEVILHETGNYKGFRYLLEDECEGHPGVNYLNGLPHPDYDKRFVDTDRTRVMYF
jgi:hypothetical protein